KKQKQAIFAKLQALPLPPGGPQDVDMLERERVLMRLQIERAQFERQNAMRGLVIVKHWEAGDDPGAKDSDDEDEAPEPAHVHRRIIVPDDYFDRWMLGSPRGGKQLQQWMEALLRQKIKDIERSHRLTAEQKKKLELAGRGDIKRLSDEVERCRKEFELVKP